MRATSHNGRVGKNGVYSPKHNDRNFDLDSAEHIDKDKVEYDWHWHMYQKEQDMTFEDCEKRFYEENFTESLNAKNERYKQDGHKERMKTMDEYRENRLSCPEETLLQVGKSEETIDPELLKKICIEHINWEIRKFPNVKVLDVSLHVDEQGAPHVHERKVWVAHSNDGLIVGQAKALDEMKIERPHPEKKKDRYNNPKTTYTAMCREHFLEVCKEHGLEIELEPDRASKRGLELTEYKRKQEQEKAEQAKRDRETAERAREVAETAQKEAEKAKEDAEQKNKDLKAKNDKLMQENWEVWQETEAVKGANEQLQAENEKLQTKNESMKQTNEKLESQNEKLTTQNAQKQAEIDLLDKNIEEAQKTLKKANTALQQVQDKSTELESVTAQVEQANKQLEQVLDMKARASEIKRVFGDKETQTYHKNMLESTRAIGHEAYEHMQDAQARERRTVQREKKLDAREQNIQRKEQEIEPLHTKASKELEKAQEYKNDVKSYIMGTAQNIIKKIQPEKDKLSDKMRKFMSEYNINGQSLDNIFDQKQAEERARQQAKLEEKARRIIRERDDWDFER